MQLKGKTALVSGASRNIGKSIALAFAREGADLILIARKLEDELKAVAKECEAFGVSALPILADMSQYEQVNRAVALGLDRFGKVDISVSVAAIRPHNLPWDYSYDEWQQVFEINVHSTFYLAKALAPGMIERKSGSFIALGGNSALTAFSPNGAATVASKHALHGLIKSLAQAFGPYGIRANLIALGLMEVNRMNPEWYPEKAGAPLRGTKNIPMRRIGRGEEVAELAVFLASDRSSYITGDRFCCDGGRHLSIHAK